MNLSVKEVKGGLLVVPQFTLVADTGSGMRPGFSSGASPADGERLFNHFLSCATEMHDSVQSGRFGAGMKVSLVNDGPVTFWLQVSSPKKS